MPLNVEKLNEQAFIVQWWERKFPTQESPKWDSKITCADAVDLLVRYREYLALFKQVPGAGS